MARKRSLFYGGISWETLYRNGDNSFIRVRVDCDAASKTLTNVTDVSGYYGQNQIIPGQQLVINPQFPSGTTIISVDTSANTIEVEDFPASTDTTRTARISPPKGQYFIESGSVTRPQGTDNSFFRADLDLTGSEDSNYNSSYEKWAVIAQQAKSTSESSNIAGQFAVYELTRVHSIINQVEFHGYISSSNDQLLGEDADLVLSDGRQAGLLTQLSLSSSLPPTFDVNTISNVAYGGGIGYASYQIALAEYYDDLRVGVYHSSSLILGNADFINFTGSAVKSIVTESIGNQTGILIEIEGGDDDTFPYTGSAEITGSLGITGSFQIESGSTKPFTVNADGTVQLFAHENSYNPTPLLGGIYFTSQSVFLGLED